MESVILQFFYGCVIPEPSIRELCEEENLARFRSIRDAHRLHQGATQLKVW